MAVREEYSYESYLDKNRYAINSNDDSIYALADILDQNTGEVIETLNQNTDTIVGAMDDGFMNVGDKITEQTNIMKKGMVGLATVQVASTALSTHLIRQTLNENANFLAKNVSKGFEILHDDLFDISSGIKDLGSEMGELRENLNIAMGNVITQIELLQDVFREGFEHISYILENRRKTDAQEHFDDALEFYADGNQFPDEPQWFKDAKKHFLASVKLYSRNPLAHLLLGHIYHYQKEHRDFQKALEHYRLCAAYGEAQKETHSIAAQGCFFTAWIEASISKNIENAIVYSKKAIVFDRKYFKAYYYLAKYYVISGEYSRALKIIETVITKHDRKYAIKVLSDPDFQPIEKLVKQLINRLKKAAITSFKSSFSNINVLLKNKKGEWYICQYQLVKEAANTAFKRNTYFDYLDAKEFLKAKEFEINKKLLVDKKKELLAEKRQKLTEAEKKLRLAEAEKNLEEAEKFKEKEELKSFKQRRGNILLIILLILGILMFVLAYAIVKDPVVFAFIIPVSVLFFGAYEFLKKFLEKLTDNKK
ncbi:hypothetical protein KAU09_01705 [Candidatus Parcubacteria bacterium]|nr:hypothetical protein [Candidatus Parcubacteria bacterium]